MSVLPASIAARRARFFRALTPPPPEPDPPPPSGGITLLGVGSTSDSLTEYPITPSTTDGDWFVDPNAGTNGTGTLVNPFNNLASAYSAVSDGQTILVRGGTITPTSRFIRSTSWSIGINVWAYGEERVTLDCSLLGTGSNSRVLTLTGAREHYKGFRVINHAGVGNDAQAIYIEGSHYTIEDVWAHDCNGTPFYVANWATGASNNVFQDCAAWRLGDGVSTDTNTPDAFTITGGTSSPALSNKIVRCFAANAPDDGVDMFRGRGTRVIDAVAYKCGWYWNGNAGSDGNGFKMGGGDNDSGDNSAVGCLAVSSRAQGFAHNQARNDTGSNPNIVFAFSTAVSNAGIGFDAGGDVSSQPNVLRDAIMSGNGTPRYVGSFATESRTTSTLSISDPLFADVGAFDWSLATGSAAIGAGLGADNLGASAVALRIAKAWAPVVESDADALSPAEIHAS